MFFKRKKVDFPERTLGNLKQITRILFIDDKPFKVINILQNSGWQNVTKIKDVSNLDQSELKDAHIIFVDIQGVGKNLGFKDEGLGLLSAIRDKYPTKKLIVYSSEEKGQIEAFHSAFDKADKRLKKDADPYEFQRVVETYSSELFTLSECANRIKSIATEYGYTIEKDEICKYITKLYEKKDTSITKITKTFKCSVDFANSIVSIIQLLLSV